MFELISRSRYNASVTSSPVTRVIRLYTICMHLPVTARIKCGGFSKLNPDDFLPNFELGTVPCWRMEDVCASTRLSQLPSLINEKEITNESLNADDIDIQRYRFRITVFDNLSSYSGPISDNLGPEEKIGFFLEKEAFRITALILGSNLATTPRTACLASILVGMSASPFACARKP
jgi:hypothetical protein